MKYVSKCVACLSLAGTPTSCIEIVLRQYGGLLHNLLPTDKLLILVNSDEGSELQAYLPYLPYLPYPPCVSGPLCSIDCFHLIGDV